MDIRMSLADHFLLRIRPALQLAVGSYPAPSCKLSDGSAFIRGTIQNSSTISRLTDLYAH